MLRVQDSGFRVQGLGFQAQALGVSLVVGRDGIVGN